MSVHCSLIYSCTNITWIFFVCRKDRKYREGFHVFYWRSNRNYAHLHTIQPNVGPSVSDYTESRIFLFDYYLTIQSLLLLPCTSKFLFLRLISEEVSLTFVILKLWFTFFPVLNYVGFLRFHYSFKIEIMSFVFFSFLASSS